MNVNAYKNKEIAKHRQLVREGFFGEIKEEGYFRKPEGIEPHDYILSPVNSVANLFGPIRQDAIDYFNRYDISWWRQNEDLYFPTGYLLSSQIHCLNHLFYFQKNKNAVLKMVQAIGQKVGVHFDTILPSFIDNMEFFNVPNGRYNYLTFEFTCQNDLLLGEALKRRGGRCTRLDVLVYAQSGRSRWLIPIEWKYTEHFARRTHKDRGSNKYRERIHEDSRLGQWNAPYKQDPFYDWARQTLFMEQLISQHPKVGKVSKTYPQYELQAENFIHVIVAPEQNDYVHRDANLFRNMLTPEGQDLFLDMTPEEFVSPVIDDFPELQQYLQKRYWSDFDLGNQLEDLQIDLISVPELDGTAEIED